MNKKRKDKKIDRIIGNNDGSFDEYEPNTLINTGNNTNGNFNSICSNKRGSKRKVNDSPINSTLSSANLLSNGNISTSTNNLKKKGGPTSGTNDLSKLEKMIPLRFVKK
jgi:hypothetical protein